MKFTVELSEEEIRAILCNFINNRFLTNIKPDQLNIEVKSKQNYKSEWEVAAIRIKQEIISRNDD